MWWRRRDERDFQAEVEEHLRLETERQALLRGLDPDEARRAARRRFGNVGRVRERFHDLRRVAWLDRLAQHLRFAGRSFRRRPAFTLTAVLTLAVGLGFNAAIFTTIYALTFRRLPVADAGALANVYQTHHGTYRRLVNGMPSMVSYREYLEYRSLIDSSRGRAAAVVSAAVYRESEFSVTWAHSLTAHGQYVSCNYFRVLDARMAEGRPFVDADCAHAGSAPIAILSHAFWSRELASDSSVLGATIRVGNALVTVVGVAAAGFAGPALQPSDLWLPVTMEPVLDAKGSLLPEDGSWLSMIVRLAPGATRAAARAELTVAAARRDRAYPGRSTTVIVRPAAFFNAPEEVAATGLFSILTGLLGLLVVGMVCANIMNLLLAHGFARRREIGTRIAIGASRGRIIEQLVIENVVLALAGGGVGLASAYALPALAARLPAVSTLQFNLSPDLRVAAFTFALSIAAALTFGLVPALQTTNVDIASQARDGGVRGRRASPARWRSAVIQVQLAGSALMLSVAAILSTAVRHGTEVDPGYITRDVVAFDLNLAMLGYNEARTADVYGRVIRRLGATPGVAGVALASPLPLLARSTERVTTFDSSGQARTLDGVGQVAASGSYLATMQIRLIAGRSYRDGDTPSGSASGAAEPVVVSRALAERLWPSSGAVGQELRIGGHAATVVGVAANTRAMDLGDDAEPFVYVPARPAQDAGLSIVVRSTLPLRKLNTLVGETTQQVDPRILVKSQRLSDRLATALAPLRASSAVAGLFALLTMLLALFGLYGVVVFSLSQQEREIAIRIALGETGAEVIGRSIRRNIRPVITGLAVGLALAMAVALSLRHVLFGLSPFDPAGYIGAVTLLSTAAIIAIYVPSRRVSRSNLAAILREN